MVKHITKLGAKISTNIIRNIDDARYSPLLMDFWNTILTLDKQHQYLVNWESILVDTKTLPLTCHIWSVRLASKQSQQEWLWVKEEQVHSQNA